MNGGHPCSLHCYHSCPETMVALLVSSIVVSIKLAWTIVMVEASRPLHLVLSTYVSKVILVVTILANFPIGTVFFYIWYHSSHMFHVLTSNDTCDLVGLYYNSTIFGTSSMLAFVCSGFVHYIHLSTWILQCICGQPYSLQFVDYIC